MNILVTGNLGYIGPILVSKLNIEGYTTFGLDTNFFFLNKKSFQQNHLPKKQLICDVRKIDSSIFKDIDIVIHLSALSNDPMGELDKGLTKEINLEASKRIAKLAKKSGVKKFIFYSSCSIYGSSDLTQYAKEDSKLLPLSEYAKSKINFEKFLQIESSEKFKCISLRNATAFGVSPNMRFDLVLNNLFASAFLTNEIRILSDGEPIRPLVHIQDIVKCTLFFCKYDISERYISLNIGKNSQNFKVKEIAKTIKKVLPKSCIKIMGKDIVDKRSYKVSFDKLSSKTSLILDWTISDGCKELLNWFRTNGLNEDKILSKKFIRIKQLNYLITQGDVNKNLIWNKKKNV